MTAPQICPKALRRPAENRQVFFIYTPLLILKPPAAIPDALALLLVVLLLLLFFRTLTFIPPSLFFLAFLLGLFTSMVFSVSNTKDAPPSQSGVCNSAKILSRVVDISLNSVKTPLKFSPVTDCTLSDNLSTLDLNISIASNATLNVSDILVHIFSAISFKPVKAFDTSSALISTSSVSICILMVAISL